MSDPSDRFATNEDLAVIVDGATAEALFLWTDSWARRSSLSPIPLERGGVFHVKIDLRGGPELTRPMVKVELMDLGDASRFEVRLRWDRSWGSEPAAYAARLLAAMGERWDVRPVSPPGRAPESAAPEMRTDPVPSAPPLPSSGAAMRRGRFPTREVLLRDVGEAVRALVAKGQYPSREAVAAWMGSNAELKRGYRSASEKAIRDAHQDLGFPNWGTLLSELGVST